jgi:glycosyltransferase involved in cell wall biosynthesis
VKILVVSTSFPRSPGDSLSPFIWEYCLGLKRRGWDVTALVPHHKGLKREETWEEIRVMRFKYLPERYEDLAYTGGIMPGLKSRPWTVFKLPLFIRSMYSAALHATKEGSFDLVNFQWLFPASFWLTGFARKRNIPIVMTGHGTDFRLALRSTSEASQSIDVHPVLKSLSEFWARRALRKCTAVTINSEYMKRRSVEDGLPLPDKTVIIPMGVDTERFSPGRLPPSHSKKLMFVGRLIPLKGLDLLIDSFARVVEKIPGAQLEIIGHGPERQRLVERIQGLGLGDSAILTGPVGHADLPEKYRSARGLALPSVKVEGLGITAVEAGACGVPTITFGLGGTSELVINEKTGLVVKKDETELAEGIKRILTDDDLVDRLGENARKKVVGNYGWGEISGRFDALYRSLIK